MGLPLDGGAEGGQDIFAGGARRSSHVCLCRVGHRANSSIHWGIHSGGYGLGAGNRQLHPDH